MIKHIRNLIWFGTVVIVVLVVAEIMSRIDDAIRTETPLLASPSYTDLTMRDSLGVRGWPGARFQKWKLNSAGFRSPEIAMQPSRNCVRLAVMGASETFGYAESPGKEFPSQLADSLNHHGCYEVLNTAVTGLSLTGQIQLWENWISRFEPEVVVVYASPVFYLSNDPPEFQTPEQHAQATTTTRQRVFSSRLLMRIHDRVHYPSFIQRRRVAKKLARSISGKPPEWFFENVPQERLSLFRQHLDSLLTSIAARGARPVLVTHAMRFGAQLTTADVDLLHAWRQFTPRAKENVLIEFENAAAETVRQLAQDRGVALVDAAKLMTGHTDWFADFTHFNDQGAAVIAHAIAGTVARTRPAPAGVVALSGGQ